MKQKIKIGIIGCGAIGSYLAKRIDRELSKETQLVAICDIKQKACQDLRKALRQKVAICDASTLIKKADFIIEATSVAACEVMLKKIIASGKDILVMSVGALLKNRTFFEKAAQKIRIHIPSGAIAGIDGLKAASIGRIERITLTTRKPIQGLRDAPFIQKMNIRLEDIKRETVIFEGSAYEALRWFPANINVAATVSLCISAQIIPTIRIVTSPLFKRNIHELEIIGDFGRIVTRAENVPSPENPKTSYLAMLSALATLKQALGPLKIGT
jgi:aspartate dehydrogenase